jgi:hypothetical protein
MVWEMVLWNWIQNCMRIFCCLVWEYCIEFVGRIYRWILSVNPPRRGGTPPSGELFCVKREMSRITVYEWVWGNCVVFVLRNGLRNGFMKLDTKCLRKLCCIWFEKWFEKWFYEIGYKIVGVGLRINLLPGLRNIVLNLLEDFIGGICRSTRPGGAALPLRGSCFVWNGKWVG